MNKKAPNFTKKQLEELYWNKNLSIAKIASIFDCSITMVHYWLLKYELKRRKKLMRGLKITKDILMELYVNRKLSLNEIAKKFGCNGTNILYWLKKFGIKRRPANQNYIHIPRETLKQLYWKKNLTTSEIARKFGIKHGRTVHKKLVKYGIKTKTVSQALTKKFKCDFSGDLTEKAYFLGLRAGDFNVRQQHKTVRIQTTSTHSAQIILLERSVEKYGEVRTYLSKSKSREDEWFIYSDLTPSFDFLLKKTLEIPDWILKNDNNFYSFLAAYMDCEGNWHLAKSHENCVRFFFRLRTGDKKILEQIRNKLSENFYVTYRLECYKGYRKSGDIIMKFNSDIYNLTINRKEDIMSLIKKLLPHSKHPEKITKMRFFLENKNKKWSEVEPVWMKIRKEIGSSLLKNQIKA